MTYLQERYPIVGKRQRKVGWLHNLWIFFGCNFCHVLPHPYHNCKFEGSAIVMGVNWMTKIASKKIENKFSKCWTKTQYCKFEGPAMTMVKIGWQNLQPKKSNWCFRFFQPWFSSPSFPHRNRRILEFAILRLRQTVLRINCWWGKLSDKNQGRKIWKCRFDFLVTIFVTQPHIPPPLPSQSLQEPRWVTKIAPKKSKTSVWLFRLWFSSRSPPTIVISARSSVSGYWTFVKHFWEFTHSNIEFEGSVIMMGGGVW